MLFQSGRRHAHSTTRWGLQTLLQLPYSFSTSHCKQQEIKCATNSRYRRHRFEPHIQTNKNTTFFINHPIQCRNTSDYTTETAVGFAEVTWRGTTARNTFLSAQLSNVTLAHLVQFLAAPYPVVLPEFVLRYGGDWGGAFVVLFPGNAHQRFVGRLRKERARYVSDLNICLQWNERRSYTLESLQNLPGRIKKYTWFIFWAKIFWSKKKKLFTCACSKKPCCSYAIALAVSAYKHLLCHNPVHMSSSRNRE